MMGRGACVWGAIVVLPSISLQARYLSGKEEKLYQATVLLSIPQHQGRDGAWVTPGKKPSTPIPSPALNVATFVCCEGKQVYSLQNFLISCQRVEVYT